MGAYIINIPDSVDRVVYTNVDPMDGKTYIASYSVDDLTPYTAPDLEQVRKEAYQQGYEQGYKDGYNEPGKGKIQVGDEIEAVFGRAVVIEILGNNKSVIYMYHNASTGVSGIDKVTKTGRHFTEIDSVLEKMRGEQDGKRREE